MGGGELRASCKLNPVKAEVRLSCIPSASWWPHTGKWRREPTLTWHQRGRVPRPGEYKEIICMVWVMSSGESWGPGERRDVAVGVRGHYIVCWPSSIRSSPVTILIRGATLTWGGGLVGVCGVWRWDDQSFIFQPWLGELIWFTVMTQLSVSHCPSRVWHYQFKCINIHQRWRWVCDWH